jgi:hypothetical protein
MATANVVQTSVSGGIQNALALQGDGVFFPKVSTASRLALTLGTSDAGFTVYDSQVGNLYFWTGTAWQSVPNSGSPGLNGQVQYNNNGTVQGATGFTFDNLTNAVSMGGDLTVDTNTLKVDSTNDRVGIKNASPSFPLDLTGTGSNTPFRLLSGSGTSIRYDSTRNVGGVNRNWILGCDETAEGSFALIPSTALGGATFTNPVYRVTAAGVHTFFDGAGGTYATLNSTGLGVGGSPTSKLTIFAGADGDVGFFRGGSTRQLQLGTSATACYLNVDNASAGFELRVNGTARVYTDVSGNVGIGVTPGSNGSRLVVESNGRSSGIVVGDITTPSNPTNIYLRTTGVASFFNAVGGSFAWGENGGATRMTLDASGNLLVGTTSGSYNRIKKDSTADAGNAIFELVGASNATSSIHYSVSSYNANAANAASKFGRDSTTLRSINAGGTVNASGADYAEYMVKCSDFVLAKGDVAGIDANGKLTNVFADAVSFVVKSTDPSYVGNDKWGVGLEGADLEAARQLVDRIAFAGQVPVNVTEAKAGDYIVPVVNGTGIKGQAVSNPTFEQYQLAVGKVISIDADGRARIIVKIA